VVNKDVQYRKSAFWLYTTDYGNSWIVHVRYHVTLS